jgi:spermidine/putrescine-binding protein
MTYPNANLAATPLLDPSIASNTLIYPTGDQQQRLFAKTEVSSEQSRTITRIWQRFKTGQQREVDRVRADPNNCARCVCDKAA